MTILDHVRLGDTRSLHTELGCLPPDEIEQQILRIRRVGKRLFGVANCVITFGEEALNPHEGVRTMASFETAFCSSVGVPDNMIIAPDTRTEPLFAQHRFVMGAPYIRFFATHPIHNIDKVPVGSVSLVDYAPRAFGEEEQQLLADLATLVEVELRLNAVSASQLDLLKKNRTLRRESLIDPLIGTWNRPAIIRSLTMELERCSKAEKPLTLAFIDFDNFKSVNDNYGRSGGDTLLMKAVSRLRSCIRPHDALGRYEGEQFMVVLPGASHVIAMAVAERMRLAIMSHPETVGDATVKLTVSAGTASTDDFPSATMDELVNHADLALNTAKEAGRNRVVQAAPYLS